MRFHVLTIFPGMFSSPMAEGILGRAQDRGLVEINLHDIRDHAPDSRRTVDDYPFGGGPGMVMKPEPLFDTLESVQATFALQNDAPVILLSPQGRMLNQGMVEELARHRDLVLICGRYEGVDERVRQHLATDEISVGDYVLSGGELAAMILIDAISRMVPGVVGSPESTQGDSFTMGLLQYPQYTRPAEFRGWAVPPVLLSGNHAEVARWRRQRSLDKTFLHRPDLLDSAHLSDEDKAFVEGLQK